MDQTIVLTVFGLGVSIIGFLLKRTDDKQEKEAQVTKQQLEKDIAAVRDKLMSETKVLWEKHDDDAERLRSFEMQIAKTHYDKTDIDGQIGELKDIVRHGFENINSRLDKMAEQQAKK